jgi:hypothetical protein
MKHAKNPASETFFMLTPNVRDRLLTAKLTAAEWRVWCYLVSLDPFGDRGAKFIPAELMIACSIGKSSYFAIKAKFQKLGLFDFKDGISRVFNLQGESKILESGILESESGILESESGILESESGILESKSPKSLSCKGSKKPQTKDIQNIQTIQTVGGEDANFQEKDAIAKLPIPDPITPSKISDTLLEPLTGALRSRLKELEIPIDKKIQQAIAQHGESKAWGAIRHIEATGETIRSKYAVFLHQLPLQPEEKLKKGLTPEFLEWYTYARGETVEDIPPDDLPLDRYGEPLVRLKSRPQDLIEWRRARSGEDLTPCSGEALRSMLDRFPGLRAKLGREEPTPVAEPAKPTEPPAASEMVIDEALKAEIEKALESNPKLKQKIENNNGQTEEVDDVSS